MATRLALQPRQHTELFAVGAVVLLSARQRCVRSGRARDDVKLALPRERLDGVFDPELRAPDRRMLEDGRGEQHPHVPGRSSLRSACTISATISSNDMD